MFWKNKTQTSLNFFGGKNAEPGELYLFFSSCLTSLDVRFLFVFFPFFWIDRSIDRSIDRERSISCKKNREAIDVMDSF